MVKRDARLYATVLLLALSALAGLLLPPEHMHSADADHHGTIHRHYQAHQVHHRDAGIEHDEADPLWLVTVGAVARRIELPGTDSAILLQSLATVAMECSDRGSLCAIPIPIHDPPHLQLAALRAPPAPRL